MPVTPSIQSRRSQLPAGGELTEPPPARLAKLPAADKLGRLLQVAKGHRRALILTHDNPDPDSIAAAVSLAHLLERKAGLEAHVGYGGIIGRAENIAFVRVLRLPVSHVSQLDFSQYDLFGLVDTQPPVRNHSLPPRFRADLVVDHHPLREESLLSPFADVGGDFGATSTMLVEYLRAARLEPSVEIATALFYGIKADTRDLGRETTQTDVDSYLWLFPRCDKQLLGQIEHPELPARFFQLFHTSIEKAKVYGTAIITDLEEVYSPDMVAEVAERMMFLEGMKWSLAYGSFRNQLFLSLRVKDRRMNAGRLIRELCEDLGGSSGGHGSMAGARLPLSGSANKRKALKREVVSRFLEAFGVAEERPVSLLSAQDT
ncbi:MULTISPECIES: bifunctional oligoribonuclease/PAP phosphatase NrnA [Corallococcus]|uniref:DHH family phosphoesterase n=1 Tax=Corallococcus TaxID=83461 RepID=UPI00117EDBDC|nr:MULTISPECIES: DHHA1 domain-containing protein [Corallococcus]NBD10930.1 bifunctional oligoribonuclease/PAP phosphatase NrnA [Corallococcus silvisoli]TSC31634.1 bifunctional oligoribonuclease/PAP phosphatase NrnA [Corallococcus sp. Z5C101001]